MFERLAYTWDLMVASWDVLRKDKQMLLFPLLSGVCCIVIVASFLIPLVLVVGPHQPGPHAHVQPTAGYYGWLFLFYFANYSVVTFFNSAVIWSAVTCIQGGKPTFGDAIKQSLSRLHLILGWALVSATVGLVLRVIEDRAKWMGRFVAGLLGMSWSLASFLVVPILVVERKGPLAALNDSTGLLQKTWGEQIMGNFGFGLIFVLLSLIPIGLGVLGFVGATQFHDMPLAVLAIGLGSVLFILLMLIQSVLHSIFQASVYLYASGQLQAAQAAQGDQTHGFPVQLLRDAMKRKE